VLWTVESQINYKYPNVGPEGVFRVSRNSVPALSLPSRVSSQSGRESVRSSVLEFRSVGESVRSSVQVGVLARNVFKWSIEIVSLYFCFGTWKQECVSQAIAFECVFESSVIGTLCYTVERVEVILKVWFLLGGDYESSPMCVGCNSFRYIECLVGGHVIHMCAFLFSKGVCENVFGGPPVSNNNQAHTFPTLRNSWTPSKGPRGNGG
jgi:hypothetical protein